MQEDLADILRTLGRIEAVRGFYLAGGTGLALQLGHRVSVDLDLFSATNTLGFRERERVLEGLRKGFGKQVVPVLVEDRTLKVTLKGQPVSLFHYPEPLVGPLRRPAGLPPLASLEDIALMKLAAIIGRGSRRDFVDLYRICRELPLVGLMELSEKKFHQVGDFQRQAMKAMVYFADAETEREVLTLEPLEWQVVKRFFEDEVKKRGRVRYGLKESW